MITFPQEWTKLKVVLCHDWLTGMRGGERVLEVLCQAFPDAPIYTLIHNPAAISHTINRHPIRTSWLQHVPGILRNYRHLLPLFPSAIERFKLPDADLVISLSHCVAKGVLPPRRTPHLCYCFTPMRYAWIFQDEYFGRNQLKKRLAAPLLARLRRWDRNSSGHVDRFVAISRHVQKRIETFYEREADIVYPPVDLGRWTPGSAEPGDYDLIVSALTPYKRLDLAIRTYSEMDFRLKIVGVGTERVKLRSLAKPNVEFLGWLPDEQVRDLYRGCRALIFPGEEDFGLVPLEAQACGRPVVAFARGGALEMVKDGVTGVLFNEQTPSALAEAIRTCAARQWNPAAIRAHAEGFGIERFVNGIADSIEKTLELKGQF